jgi:hypothetical protein
MSRDYLIREYIGQKYLDKIDSLLALTALSGYRATETGPIKMRENIDVIVLEFCGKDIMISIWLKFNEKEEYVGHDVYLNLGGIQGRTVPVLKNLSLNEVLDYIEHNVFEETL